MKDIFTNIIQNLKDGNRSLKAVQKVLINSVGERDYSAQETCHLLLRLPMIKSSRDFIVLSLDGSQAVEDRLKNASNATAPSVLDHYLIRLHTAQFNSITLLEYAQQYSIPKGLNTQPKRRTKKVVVLT